MTPPDAAEERDAPTWFEVDVPFKFLDHFKEEDEEIFAGRDREIQIILAGVLRAPSFVLYGGSGTGKTSLLFAGLFPKLRRQGFRPIYVRTLNDPLADLRSAVLEELPERSEDRDPDGLPELLAALTADQPAVLVFDQFEEFFLRFRERPESRQAFIETLGTIVDDPRLAVKLLFSLRQEYLGELDDFRRHLPRLLDNEYRLPRLTAFGARRSIASQLQRAEVPFERRFLTRIVDLLEDYRFDPTILQILCSEIYRQAFRTGRDPLRLTAEDVEEVGDLRMLFWRHLDQMASALPSGRQLTVRAVLDALIGGEQTRRAANFATLYEESIRSTDPDEIREVLEVLRGYRLVHVDDQGQECWYELTHERLVPVVREWLERDHRFRELRTARQLVADTARGGQWRRDPELLLTDYQLERVVDPVRELLPVTPNEIEFLLKSAVFRGSRDAAVYWSARHGPEEGRRLVLEMLEGDDPKAVLGAARVARHLGDSGDELARACARRAVDEADEAIAAEAFFSLLELTRSRRASRRLIQEALAERDAPRERPLLHHRLYRWARFQRCLFKTRKQAARQALSPEYRGLKARVLDTLAAAILWSFIVGPMIYLGGVWPTGKLELAELSDVAEGIGSLAPAVSLIALVLAAGLTYAVARSLGRDRPTWPLVVRKSMVLPLLCLAAVALVAFALRKVSSWVLGALASVNQIVQAFTGSELPTDPWFLFILPLVAVPVLFWAASLFVRAGSAVFRPGAPEHTIWGWSLIASCGLPILVPAALVCAPALLAARLGRPEFVDEAAVLAVALALPSSFLTFLFFQLLSRSGLPPTSGEVTEERRQRARMLAVAALAVTVLGWLALAGLDTVRFVAPRCPIESFAASAGDNACSTGHLGPGFPDADYRKIDVERPVLLQLDGASIESLQGVRAWLEDIDLSARTEDDLLALPATGVVPPFLDVSIGPTDAFRTLRREWRLRFDVLDVLDVLAGQGPDPATGPLSDAWSYRFLELGQTGCEPAVEGPQRDSSPVARCGDLAHPGFPAASGGEPSMVELIVFRHQLAFGSRNVNYPVMVHTSGPGSDWRPAGREEPQNCVFENAPVANDAYDDRERWKVPVCADGSWRARVRLEVDPKDAARVPFLIVGTRRVPSDGSPPDVCSPARAGPTPAERLSLEVQRSGLSR